MPKKISQEQFWKLYDKLPQDLKDSLFSNETGKDIYEVCSRHKIEDKLSNIVDYVGQVLVGILAPEDFQKTLEKDLKVNKETAKEVTKEISRLILYPVRPALEKIHGTGLARPEKAKPEKIKKAREETNEEPEASPSKDTYREPIE